MKKSVSILEKDLPIDVTTLPKALLPDVTRRIQVFKYIEKHDKTIRSKLEKDLKLGDREARRILNNLVSKGLVKATKENCVCGNVINFWQVVKNERKKR